MKKIYTFILFSLFLFSGEKSFSQSFTFSNPDTAICGATGSDLECLGDSIINNTSNSLAVDVVRVQDDVGTPGWTSAFCLAVCYLPSKDSMRLVLTPHQHQNLLVHFYTSATADCGTVLFKIKDVNTPTNVAYQRYYASTQSDCACLNAGVNELSANSAKVKVYPSPLIAGNDFNMNISNVQGSKEISLLVYSVYGSVVNKFNNLKEGNNTLNLNLPAGVYSYSLISNNVPIGSGKLAVSR